MSPEVSSIIIALIAGLTGSGGCSIILYLLQRRDRRKDGHTEKEEQRDDAMKRQSAMLLGLAHDRIVFLGGEYIKRGYVTPAEYENLHDYLFEPYQGLHGNGTAEKVMVEVDQLPLYNPKEEHHERRN